ncbi:MAG: hypothetical protein QXX70_00375, partial [Candidatus Micrarchaeaceae archaeon]
LPRKPNVQFWCKIMLWHAPVISRYARQKLEKWYWEDEPKWIARNVSVQDAGKYVAYEQAQ